MARPKGTKQLLAAVALILCALALTAAGLAVRRQQFDRTLALRFADDVSHGFGWGRIARQVGLFHVYDLQAAGRIDNPPNGLDYTPLRLTVMSGWAAWAERHYPDVTSWRNDYAFMAPVLGLNIAAEWASAVLAFTLVRHWVRKAAAARRPLEPPTPCTGTARGLLAAAFLWFNPAVIWDGTCFPQWDIWLAPFFLAAVLLGCTEWWLAAGCCVAVGAFLKGQILLVAPIFLIWPVAQGRLLPAARFAAGFVLAAAVIALPWMQPPAAGLWWLGFTALGIGLTAFLALDRRIPVRWPLAAAALGAAFAWPFGAAAVPLRALPPVLVVATVLTRVLPRLDGGRPGFAILYVCPLKALINDQHRRLEGLLQACDVPLHRWHGDVPADAKETLLKDVNVDDTFFGVSALSANGVESIVTFGGRAPRR